MKRTPKTALDSKEVTPEWLTGVLRHAGVLNTRCVQSFERVALKQGATGQVERLWLSYDICGEGLPQSLILKTFSVASATQSHSFELYAREIRFYQEIANKSHFYTPHCVYSFVDSATNSFILLLEDLSPAHSGGWFTSCSIEEATLAIQEIAKFHATWWESKQLEISNWLLGFIDVYFRHVQCTHSTRWKSFLEKVGKGLPDRIIRIGPKLERNIPAIFEHIKAAPSTIIHFDYKMDNLFFDLSQKRHLFAVFDWQTVSRGRGVYDVAYFMSNCLRPEDRKANEVDLLRKYHAILVENGNQGYSFDMCLYDYRYFMLHRLIRLVSIIGDSALDHQQERSICDIILPRCIAAILDLDSDTLLSD